MTIPRIKVYGEFFAREVSAATRQALRTPLFRCGLLVESQAKRALNTGGGTPQERRTSPWQYYNVMRGGYVTPSQPGQPPHAQVGNLKSAVTTAPTGKDTVVVGPTRQAWYGKVHEHGKRPFMVPALNRARPGFKRLLRSLPLASTPEGRKLNERRGKKPKGQL